MALTPTRMVGQVPAVGLVTTDHLAPFQCRISGTPWLPPTAQASAGEVALTSWQHAQTAPRTSRASRGRFHRRWPRPPKRSRFRLPGKITSSWADLWGARSTGHFRDALCHRAWRAQRDVHPAVPGGGEPARDHRAVVAYSDVIGV